MANRIFDAYEKRSACIRNIPSASAPSIFRYSIWFTHETFSNLSVSSLLLSSVYCGLLLVFVRLFVHLANKFENNSNISACRHAYAVACLQINANTFSCFVQNKYVHVFKQKYKLCGRLKPINVSMSNVPTKDRRAVSCQTIVSNCCWHIGWERMKQTNASIFTIQISFRIRCCCDY